MKHKIDAFNSQLANANPIELIEFFLKEYKGRIGLHELLIATDDIKKLIQERARVSLIFAAAVEGGMRTLKMDGLEKIMMGLTDIKMVRSVCIK